MVTRFKIGQPLSQASLWEEGATTIRKEYTQVSGSAELLFEDDDIV